MDTAQLTQQILQRADELAKCTESSEHLTRRAFTGAMKDAHLLVAKWCTELGFRVESDAAGNLRATSPWGRGPALLCGSHLDTIRNAGRYDGMLGVLLMLAAIARTGPLEYPVEIVGFSDEEGVRFRRPYMGSRAMAEGWTPEDLSETDEQGVSVEQALQAWGHNVADLAQARLDPSQYFAFFEPHIEQGPVLESRELPVGAVTAICAQHWLEIRFRGQASHAGTTPMSLRKDALAAAAEVILGAERMAHVDHGLVVTVGRINIAPNVGNVVPGEASFSIDIRHHDNKGVEEGTKQLLQNVDSVAKRRGLEAQHQIFSQQPAVTCDPHLRDILTQVITEEMGKRPDSGNRDTWYELPSGAGHDARIIAPLLPIAMLFLRSPRGLSHHPEEDVLAEDVLVALDVTVAFLLRLRSSFVG